MKFISQSIFHLLSFLALSILTPIFFKQFPFLTLPTLGIIVVLVMRRDFAITLGQELSGEAPETNSDKAS